MIFQSALAGSLFVAAQVLQASAGHPRGILDASHLLPRGENFEHQIRRHAEDVVAKLVRRQSPSATASAPTISTTPQSGDATKVDLNKWETQTQQACSNALSALNGQASNPSGMAVCYNLPFLDNTTGVFEAELRMYNVSMPIDPWVGITSADVSMTLKYLGATVQATNGTFMKRDSTLSWPPVRRDIDLGSELVYRQSSGSGAAPPGELKVLTYVGKINSNLMGSAMSQANLQSLLVPQIVLTANSPKTGKQISTTLSSTEASFVNGVFAKAATPVSPSASASASAIGAAATQGANYVLPGTKLAFFPVGLVVTCVWTAGLFLAVGLGTIGRIQFREQYRRRMKREMTKGVSTI
ncbi:uncharacterized protein BDZ99DRAFT_456890 [Mytilinidion resinicola]|uniref:Uncharacterized protein n=1 Tax=Mytilinidion resinicola TaxID=574789 RepID=A0A6A6Z8R7_9PEZI|nr:uncharacterized protein BDZ99DRAFT_456890 [Mytilinidion resinicola]KAF2817099.1 hypothetical protein BDZ99DRAFT_456890 [Mytilinidion resinicola]